MKNKTLFSILLVVFIDLLGFSLILPLLPYFAKTFNASDTEIGLLVAIYAAAQLIGAPILGRLSDRYGRRPVLLISIAGNLIGYILLGFAQGMVMLFAARLLAGITAANISVAQAYISDITDEKNRSKGLGMIGAAFGLGFIIGPAAGGALSTFGYSVPAFLSAGLGVINLILVALWLPESLSPERRAALAKKPAKDALAPKGLWAALQRPVIGPLLSTRFFYGMAFSIFQTIFALYALSRFGVNAQNTGFILAYVGVLSVITQGFIVGRLTARYPESRLIFVMAIIMAVSLFGWAVAPNILTLLIILAPTAFSAGILNTVINSAISKSVPPVEVGGMLGFAASLEAGTRVIAPTLGGIMLDQISSRMGVFAGTAAPGLFAAILMSGVVFYIWRHVLNGTTAIASPPVVLVENSGN
ncbi:MAG: MFS transporter [Anaerolineaceae bacterium]|nr:MFS transporter [Anaerolineaceae bacterium]